MSSEAPPSRPHRVEIPQHRMPKLMPVEPGRCLVIGEVAQAHEGSLGLAHAFVDAIAGAGADAVKFQVHIASAESTPSEPWRVKFSQQDDTRFDYWKRMEFTEAQWSGLARHAEEQALHLVVSPFSIEAVEMMTRVGVAAWKIASGETAHGPLLAAIAATKLPVLLSTGMSPMAEVDAAVDRLKRATIPLTVLQCTSAYPCPPEKVGLNLIARFRERYGCPVGLSDHSGTIYPGLAAAALGLDVLEVHVTLSREMFGPDVPVSVTTAELRQLVEGVRFIERMRDNPVDKDAIAGELQPMRETFTRSLATRSALAAGTVLTADHLALRKPGTGIAAARLEEFIGRRLTRDVAAGVLLKETDVEDAGR